MRGYISVVVFSLLGCFLLADAVDARLFDRLRDRRGGGDGNEVNSAPTAPADLAPEASPLLPSSGGGTEHCVQSYDQYGMPINTCDRSLQVTRQQNYSTPQVVPVAPMPQAYSPQASLLQTPTVRLVPVTKRAVVDTSAGTLAVDARVDRLVTALENRLGIKPEPAVTGNSQALFNELPVVEVVLKNQKGEIRGSAQLDTKAWVLEQINQ